ncbi:MAG: divalent-cation tolerance protein CutA [Candidatus Aenigmarchaeota archaeon]|nr:divalent-cation tolerance protein CutA [Candidatus Aenigmarchaeota archaeon]
MYVMAVTTCPDKRTAKKIADAILDKKLAACVNIIPGITSKYWWKGKKEEGTEVVLFIKTRERLVKKIGELLKNEHPYELAELIAMPLGGSKKYLDWIGSETS